MRSQTWLNAYTFARNACNFSVEAAENYADVWEHNYNQAKA